MGTRPTCTSLALIAIAIALVTAALLTPCAQLPTIVAGSSDAGSVRHAGMTPGPLVASSLNVKRHDTTAITSISGVAQGILHSIGRTALGVAPISRHAPDAAFMRPLRI